MKTKAILAALLAFPSVVFADFKGGDTFANFVQSNWFFESGGGGNFGIPSSRLDYLVQTPENENFANLIWQTNTGGYNQNWFLEVEIFLGIFAFPNDRDYQSLTLNVFPTADRGPRLFSIGLIQNRVDGFINRGIAVRDTRAFGFAQASTAPKVTVRLHHDQETRTITPSWNTGSGWLYGGARDVVAWDMKPSESFIAFLKAENGAAVAGDAKVFEGQAWFRNFRTGNSSPEIVVQRSAKSEIKSKKGTISFGAAKAGSGKVTKIFRIRNHGTAELKNLKLSVSGTGAGDFNFSKLAKNELIPGASTTFRVIFKPDSKGASNAKIFLTSNDADESAFQINVSGRGAE